MSEHAELALAQRYAMRSLDPAAANAFEDHLLGCAACQTEVKLTIGLRGIIRAQPLPLARRRGWMVGVPAVLAAAAVIVAVTRSQVDPRMAAVGAVNDPPSYVGLAVRAAASHGDSLFEAAMTAYAARRYDAATRDLSAALAAGVDSIPVEFFLASAQLMAGGNREAVEGYRRVIAAGPRAAPYAVEAHLFRAKALLRLGRADEALAELHAVGANEPEAPRARALADSIHGVITR